MNVSGGGWEGSEESGNQTVSDSRRTDVCASHANKSLPGQFFRRHECGHVQSQERRHLFPTPVFRLSTSASVNTDVIRQEVRPVGVGHRTRDRLLRWAAEVALWGAELWGCYRTCSSTRRPSWGSLSTSH